MRKNHYETDLYINAEKLTSDFCESTKISEVNLSAFIYRVLHDNQNKYSFLFSTTCMPSIQLFGVGVLGWGVLG